ncbi:hypothetical protein BKA70DRAFT_1095064 [Coprinopsis sp. MPI-PUGE-AT-0042]|nr:hypothetical protein BKA70DRAFT_1095064 [Coprinopsis sp. MPI-PUGE-AT-0042]
MTVIPPLDRNDPSTWTGNNVEVNDFMFCAVHGNEYCIDCACDHRMCNNVRIDDQLGQEFGEHEHWERDDRQPIMNVYAMGAKAARHDNAEFQCIAHRRANCKTCFNWPKIIKSNGTCMDERKS